MPLTLGTLSFVLAVGSLVVALTKRADTGEWRWLLGSAALILGTLHFVVPLPKITQTVLSIGAILVFTLLIFARCFQAPPR
ncbi:MAG TPA: hypothetical protein VGQ10_08200 [Vicinamibacterales bacterium]|nr:hypothetical protein [Vicinamibacterales bacterium]